LQGSGGPRAAVSGRSTVLFYSPLPTCQTSAQPARRSVCSSSHLGRAGPSTSSGASSWLCIERSAIGFRRSTRHRTHRLSPYPSFAVMEIFAFSTFDTGQPFSAASAYF